MVKKGDILMGVENMGCRVAVSHKNLILPLAVHHIIGGISSLGFDVQQQCFCFEGNRHIDENDSSGLCWDVGPITFFFFNNN
jgi:hypothetical protein